LKDEHRIARRPEFPILFGRIRDRISTLSRLYGAGILGIDYLGTNERAARVRMTVCELRHRKTERRSTKTGQLHSIGGFVGVAEYEGDLSEFLPWLHAARWTGVGRHAVWGKGEISTCVPPFAPRGTVYPISHT
jgi:CRISPR-associated endoribonuclease Cas6